MIVVSILLVLIYVCHITRGVFSPARLFAFMWALLIMGYYLFAKQPVSGIGLLWVAVAVLLFAVGEHVGIKHYRGKNQVSRQAANHNSDIYSVAVPKSQSKGLYKALLFIILIALAGKICFLYANGYSISVFFSIDKFLAMNAKMAYDRYHQLTVTNNLITLLSSFGYVAPLCGGYLLIYAGRSKKRYLISIFSLFPVLLSMLMDNTKSGVIDAAILFVIGFMISYMRTRKRCPKFRFTQIILCIFLLLLLFLVLFAAMCVRLGDFSANTISTVKDKFLVYAFGSVEAFDIWLTRYYSFGSYGLGVNTFMAPFNLLGVVNREQGVYGFIPEASSNVFSAFRGLIMDFGIIGGLVFMFAIGIICGKAYVAIRQKGSVAAQFVYACIVFFLIRSFLISPWIYTSFWVSFIVFLLFLCYASVRIPAKRVLASKARVA